MFESVFMAHVTTDGELVNVSSQFLSAPAEAARRGRPHRDEDDRGPPISAPRALTLAALDLDQPAAIAEQVEEAGDSPNGWRRFRSGAWQKEARARLTGWPWMKRPCDCAGI